ncbi:hypothetical protein LV780_09505 [Cereibacter azotoformans]|uniref:F5/8 type C domain-containing protein n=1 Tax=Cereibacter azotoformans TaxID=43057 RepID=A0A2T5JLL7_9RHOB|nr:hypothetical protein [Cereibacter azotoformans]AXQ94012.1 hypothetical protein D0Z66_09530 [Cereibacter sphaeroides]PTR07776.1 hypothetical protein C8J28_13811 [Cereibacter azotoformans]UIJ29537.1 hypothetical protein LV780_09505 [Cereibacter azotoformans]
MRDLYSNIKAVPALAPAVQAAAANGLTVDLINTWGVAFVVNTGAIAGSGDFGVKLQESDDGTTWGDVPETSVKSDAPATLDASKSYRLGYGGFKRYARVALTKAGGTSIAAGAVAIISPADKPVA